MMSHSLCAVRHWVMISKLMVLDEQRYIFLSWSVTKIGGIQETNKGLLIKGPYSQFNSTHPDWRSTGTWIGACCLVPGAWCLVQWHVRHHVYLKGITVQWREQGILTWSQELERTCEWSLGSEETSRIAHKLNLYKWAYAHRCAHFSG